MKSEIRYKIIPSLKLIVEYYSGDIYFDNYVEQKSIQISSSDYNPAYNVLIDLRDSKLFFTHDEIKKLVEALMQNNEFIGKRKIAQLTSLPEHVVVATLINSKETSPLHLRTFSTVKESLKFLEYSSNESKLVEEILSEIKTLPNNK